MVSKGFDKLYYGFIFIMVSFRIQGIDILPDIVGYILFAYGLSCLSEYSYYFEKASKLNYPMIFLSIFTIYQKPVTDQQIQISSLGAFGIVISLTSFVLNLLIIYYIFMGIKDMADAREKKDIANEAIEKWNYYKYLMIAVLLSFVIILIPTIAIIYIIILLIASICILISILKFIKKCEDSLKSTDEA